MSNCFSCGQQRNDVEERWSYGIYAGKMCRKCATTKYRDSCGLLDGEQGDPNELREMGERIEEDE